MTEGSYRFTVAPDRIEAALPFVQEYYPKATLDTVRKALTGEFPGMDTSLRLATDRDIRDYQEKLDQSDPATLASLVNGIINDFAEVEPLEHMDPGLILEQADEVLGIGP